MGVHGMEGGNMKLVLKDKTYSQFVLDSNNCEPQKRGGRGRRSSAPLPPLKLVPRIFIQLLPGQSIELTCPDCGTVRTFSKTGGHHINQICKKCLGELPDLDATETLHDPASTAGLDFLLQEMAKS